MKNLYFFIFLFALAGCQSTVKDSPEDYSNETDLSGSITIEGTELKYIIKGEGEPFVMLGFPEYFSENLEAHFQLFFFDTRTTAENYSPIKPEEYTIETLLRDIDTLRSAAGLQNFIIGGHSILGIVAYEYAKRYPEHVSHVVMIGTPSTYATDEFRNAGREYWNTASPERKALFKEKQKQLSGTLDQLSPRETLVKSVVSESPKRWHDPNFDDTPILEKVSYNMDFVGHLYGRLFSDYHMFDPNEEPTIPVFVAAGKSDYVCPPMLWIGKYDHLANLTVSVFDKSGHTPQYEQSELFKERLINWVKNN